MRTMFGYIDKLEGYAKWVRIYYVRRNRTIAFYVKSFHCDSRRFSEGMNLHGYIEGK
jgi:hypothetical protein